MQSEAQKLESSLAELEEKLKDAQALAANTETELRTVRTELYKVSRREYGFISSDFYADRGLWFLTPEKVRHCTSMAATGTPQHIPCACQALPG